MRRSCWRWAASWKPADQCGRPAVAQKGCGSNGPRRQIVAGFVHSLPLHDEGIRYIVQNLYPRGNILVDLAGLRVPMDAVDVVIPPPANFPEGTAFGLYRLK